jgi:hypothetical protein
MELYLSILKLNNLWIIHIYTLVEYSSLMVIFSYWQKDIILKKIYKLSIPLFALIWVGAKMTLEKLNQFDQVTASLEGLILVAVSLYSLYSTSIASWNGLLKDSRFWVAAAVLIYFLSNLAFFALGNVIIKWSMDKIKLAYTLSWITVIFSNILYAKGFLCEKHPLDPFEHGDSIPIPSDLLLK